MLVGGAGTTLLVIVLTVPFTLYVWKSSWDYYAAYSGVVVDKQREFHLLGLTSRFLILDDGRGHQFKKYVDSYGYAFAKIGTFVVKKQGFGEYPRQPGEKTPSELRAEAERIKAQKRSLAR